MTLCRRRRSLCLSLTLSLFDRASLSPPIDLSADTYWHRDESQPDQWPMPKSRVIKSFVYLSDVGPEDGPLALVGLRLRVRASLSLSLSAVPRLQIGFLRIS